jgi:hypothetical protein
MLRFGDTTAHVAGRSRVLYEILIVPVGGLRE